METRTCRVCGLSKSATMFYKGHGNLCKECAKAKTVAWRKSNPVRYRATRRAWEGGNQDLAIKRRKTRLRRRYKITPEQIEERLKSQNYRCAICGVKLHSPFDKDPDEDTTKPVVDHDHRDGHVRGILCSACNVALGLLEDDPAVIKSAYHYLKRDQNA